MADDSVCVPKAHFSSSVAVPRQPFHVALRVRIVGRHVVL